MNIFIESDYRKIIGGLLSEKKKISSDMTYQSMADFMRIQKSYLSNVMNGRADFSTDQLYMAGKYLNLTMEQLDYLQLLLEYERSIYPERKEELLEKIESVQGQQRDIKKNLGRKIKELGVKDFDPSLYGEYYLDPIIQLTHMILTLPRFSKDPSKIAEHLIISQPRLAEAIAKLEKMQLIETKNGKVNVLIRSLHLPSDSSLLSPHQTLLKLRGMERLKEMDFDQKKQFSVVFTSNKKLKAKVDNAFNKFINELQELSKAERHTDCYQLNFEFFPWTD